DLGMMLTQQQRPKEAVPYLRAALALRSDDPYAHCQLGDVLEAAGDREEAIRCYQTALRINPRYAPAHVSLGLAFRGKGDADGALREYQAALDIYSRTGNAYDCCHNVGLLLQTKDPDGAILAFQAALQIDPNHLMSHEDLGSVLLLFKGDLDGAIRE